MARPIEFEDDEVYQLREILVDDMKRQFKTLTSTTINNPRGHLAEASQFHSKVGIYVKIAYLMERIEQDYGLEG